MLQGQTATYKLRLGEVKATDCCCCCFLFMVNDENNNNNIVIGCKLAERNWSTFLILWSKMHLHTIVRLLTTRGEMLANKSNSYNNNKINGLNNGQLGQFKRNQTQPSKWSYHISWNELFKVLENSTGSKNITPCLFNGCFASMRLVRPHAFVLMIPSNDQLSLF